jgi:hypothetical protein
MADFGISGIKPSGSATREFYGQEHRVSVLLNIAVIVLCERLPIFQMKTVVPQQ